VAWTEAALVVVAPVEAVTWAVAGMATAVAVASASVVVAPAVVVVAGPMGIPGPVGKIRCSWTRAMVVGSVVAASVVVASTAVRASTVVASKTVGQRPHEPGATQTARSELRAGLLAWPDARGGSL
jgi:hypothetical protein